MIVSIVACGESAKDWHNTPHDYSIGVNDAFKWGHKFNCLAIFNHRTKFSQSRLQMIFNTRPIKLYTHCLSWEPYFPDHQMVKLRSWDGHLYKDCQRLTHADTSPIIAMSLAHCLGATTMILWGVDMITHWIYSSTNPHTQEEVRKYRGYIEALQRSGISVYIGAKPSALENFVPVYQAEPHE